ncbi:hypothetical protein F5876DRAFT_69730 [Lentinula aff. lateritia]|uniref:Uncharacterized protein n=1 Tax=Lentinula aff. lateritia TaxID=2804960 RepID=A0ACC1TLS0_9AGAR|nr:hypothetical protein F5876DRAFT_69730 [Lentinula aff. lateritia]
MGMFHIPTSIPDRHVTIKGIRARIYSASSATPRAITAHVRQNARQPANTRFVLASSLLSGPRRQSYVHDITLKIRYRGIVFKFLVFFKRHKMLPLNLSIHNLGGRDMKGDFLLVACGTKVSIRNLRSGLEVRAADEAVIRLTEAMDPIASRRTFPSAISFM